MLYDGGLYRVLLLLHVICVIVGFGGVVLNALYGQQVRARQGPEGLAILEANFRVSSVAQYFVYGVPVTGILGVLASHDAAKFSQTWVWFSLVLYVVGVGVSHSMVIPSVKRMIALQHELLAMGPPPAGGPPPGAGGPPPQVVEMSALGQKLGMATLVLDVLLVVILILMIWKPGL